MQKFFKVLTFIISLSSFSLSASSVDQEVFNTHLRWILNTSEGQVNIKQDGSNLTIKTLDANLFNSLKKDLVLLKTDSNYIKSIKFNSEGLPNEAAIIDVELKDKSIELFSFYKASDKKYIVDFWINEDLVDKKDIVQKQVAKAAPKKVAVVSKPKKTIKKIVKIDAVTESKYRDFRYGSSFIFDQQAKLPVIKEDINLNLKAPNYFYNIKDRNLSRGEKEAHMQLSINFYKKSKWGLMTKSISLYESKYGNDTNKDLNDFMKAVSLIKNQINPKVASAELSKNGAFEAALNILSSISARSDDYDIKKAATRYVLQASRDKSDDIKTLQLAKRLYVLATEEFDDEIIVYSSKVILNSLAKLKQLAKIEEFLANKAVIRVLPKQIGFGYRSYVHFVNGKHNKLISEFEAKESALQKPILSSILFNVAESYFMEANYEKAIKLYDNYIADYSQLSDSSVARLRLAISYDLLNRDFKKVSELYKSAINKSSDVKSRYEAKIRYVGHDLLRKKNIDERDLELTVFLNQNEEEKASLDKDLKKLLWLTRLRVLVVENKFKEALAYISSIPVNTMNSVDKSVFEADGAEVILGVIKESYLEQNYAKAIKVWNVYKDKYVTNIARNPYLRFLVTDSYLRLGLNKSFNDSLAKLSLMDKMAPRTFPLWVQLHKNVSQKDLMIDIKIAKLVNDKLWTQLDKYLDTVKENKNINYSFYKGLVSFKRGFYNKAVTSYEKVIVSPNETNTLSPLENRSMLSNYIESLFEVNQPAKFRKNVGAIIADLRRTGQNNMSDIIERSEYLLIESMFSNKKSLVELNLKTEEFLKEFKDSSYKSRVKYVSAITHLNSNKKLKGKEILEELLAEKDTPEYLKGLARSELTGLVLENINL